MDTAAVPNAPAEGQPTQPQDAAAASGAPQDTGAAVKEAAKEAARKLKIKEGDQEIEVDEEEVLKVYRERKGHQKVATKEFQDGQRARKQALELVNKLKDPASLFEAIKQLGHDPRKLSETYLSGILEEETMDPKDRELKKAQMRLKEYEELQKKAREAEQLKARKEMEKKFSEEYSAQFVDALQKTKLEPTKTNVGKMASYIRRAAEINFEMTAMEAATLVRQDLERYHTHNYASADIDTLVKLLGETGIAKIREYDAKRLRDPAQLLKTPEEQAEITRRKAGGRRMTPSEWRSFNRGQK